MAEYSPCDKEPPFTPPSKDESGAGQQFLQNKQDSFKCQYCKALFKRLDPSSAMEKSIELKLFVFELPLSTALH